MTVSVSGGPRPFASGSYWRNIFARNPDFCSWQSDKQVEVLSRVRACLNEQPGQLRVLDFGIGNMGLYRALDEGLMQRISLTGISESRQHTAEDPLLPRYGIRINIGPGLSPCRRLPIGSADFVVCTYVFAYLDAQARAETLAVLARALVPGGRMILVLHHPGSERARKFRCSEPYWPDARLLYDRLVEGRYSDARMLLRSLTELLSKTFAADERYRRYLASYLKTARRFLRSFCADEPSAEILADVPESALIDCREMRRLIDREWAMTCRSFHPVENPADLALPGELALSDITACVDPTCGLPVAHVVTATASNKEPPVFGRPAARGTIASDLR